MTTTTLPTSWSRRRLGDCGQWISGGTPRKSEPSYWHGNIPWFSAKSLKSFELCDSEDRVTQAGAENGTSLVPKGTVLFVVRGMSLANEFRVGVTSREATLNQDLRGIIPFDDVDSRYLARYLRQSPDVLDKVDNASHGTKRIESERLKAIEIPLPPLREQQRLAAILDKGDTINQKRQNAIVQFDALAASLFMTFFATELSSPLKSRLDQHLLELRYGTSNKSSVVGKHALRIPNVIRGTIDLRDLKRVAITDAEFERLALRDGDLLFVRTNGNPAYVGRCAVFDASDVMDAGLDPTDFIYASYLIRGRLNQQTLKPLFLQHYLQTDVGRQALRDRCRTSAGQYNINTRGIGSIDIPDVAIDRQNEFIEQLRAIKQVRTRLFAAADDSDSLFSALVQRAFSGEL